MVVFGEIGLLARKSLLEAKEQEKERKRKGRGKNWYWGEPIYMRVRAGRRETDQHCILWPHDNRLPSPNFFTPLSSASFPVEFLVKYLYGVFGPQNRVFRSNHAKTA